MTTTITYEKLEIRKKLFDLKKIDDNLEEAGLSNFARFSSNFKRIKKAKKEKFKKDNMFLKESYKDKKELEEWKPWIYKTRTTKYYHD